MSKITDIIKELRGLTISELSVRIIEARKEAVHLQQAKLLGKLKNTQAIGQTKKTIARMQTILDEKISENLNA